MILYLLALLLILIVHLYYRLPFWLLSIFWFLTPFICYKLKLITNTQGIITLFLILNIIIIGNFNHLRRLFFTLPLLRIFNSKDRINWQRFKNIDDGWLVTDFEKALYNGQPDFNVQIPDSPPSQSAQDFLNEIGGKSDLGPERYRRFLSDHGIAALAIDKNHAGHGFNRRDVAHIINGISQYNPLLAALIGIINTESVISLINRHGTPTQREDYLPAFAKGEKQPFLNTTFLYELLENGRSSIEGRLETDLYDQQDTVGIRLSFTDIIMLGTARSSVFYVAVNLSDFTNLLSGHTRLGTVLCLLDSAHDNIEVIPGNEVYKGLFNYYRCSAKDIFIPMSQIIGGETAINQGIRQLFLNQAQGAGVWPAAVSRYIQDSASYFSWYFAHIKKQNSRPLMDYRLVRKQLNRQFSYRQRLINVQQTALINGDKPLMSYTNILFKNSLFDASLQQLNWLRTILGSHAHQIKSEHKLNQYFRVKHLSMELDGHSHEINQLPLMKKVALSAHPWYKLEIAELSKPRVDSKKLDKFLFKHLAYILHNIVKVWVYAVRTSWLGRFFWRKSKHKNRIRRLSSSYALIADLALIKWSLRKDNNTEFTAFLAECNQHLVTQMAVLSEYRQHKNHDRRRFVLKQSLRDSYYLCQKALNQSINSAFDHYASLLLKIIIFPFGKPFHPAGFATDEALEPLPERGLQHPIQATRSITRVADASHQLLASKKIETAVTNATGLTVTSKNYQVLIDRSLAAGIISVEQAEQLRAAYDAIHDLEIINHFGNHYDP
ncbi:acyl-CoA dehydrogenase [Marinicella pacifica]|uniref:medium-chain acyl-CoA dehydrogenase n=1 Tax=Marinicella pacifica TaxID=1171543 RepID=A0A917CL36_9GAMM|nr:acyl-CoA dehydrogenase domain-containing protein [Marinicella pacifica]GGF89775.1 acyl-CoA dehydrogenase [Marinicella pacifica]